MRWRVTSGGRCHTLRPITIPRAPCSHGLLGQREHVLRLARARPSEDDQRDPHLRRPGRHQLRAGVGDLDDVGADLQRGARAVALEGDRLRAARLSHGDRLDHDGQVVRLGAADDLGDPGERLRALPVGDVPGHEELHAVDAEPGRLLDRAGQPGAGLGLPGVAEEGVEREQPGGSVAAREAVGRQARQPRGHEEPVAREIEEPVHPPDGVLEPFDPPQREPVVDGKDERASVRSEDAAHPVRLAGAHVRVLQRGRSGRVVGDEHVDQSRARGAHDRRPLAGSRGDGDDRAGPLQLIARHAEQELLALERDRLPVNVEVARDDVAGCMRELAARRREDVRRRRVGLRRRRADADERRREPVPQLQPRSRVVVRQEGPPELGGRHGRRVQELDVGTAHGGDAPGDLVRLEAPVHLVERGDGRDELDAGQRREVLRGGDLGEGAPPRDGQRVARLQGEPRDLVERRRHDAVQAAAGRRRHDDDAPEPERLA